MNNNQTAVDDDDLSSTTGSDFEPVDVPHQEEQEPLNDENAQPTLAVSQPQHMTAMNVAALNARVHWLEKQLLIEKLKVSEEKLKVAEANKEKVEANKVGLKVRLEMMEQQQKLEGDDQMGKKISELVGTKLTENFQNMKENIMEMTRKLIQAEFSTFKQGIEKRLVNVEKRFEKLDQLGVAKHALNKQLLEWLTTGVGLLRNVSLWRVVSNALVTFGGWSIRDGRLKAKKIERGNHRCVRAEKPFPVASVCPEEQLLFYFEVTVITTKSDSYMFIGLYSVNYPFTTSTSVGWVAGSFAIFRTGTYCASGKRVSGHGKGGFASGDVVGCGLLILPEERRIFFTKNGEIWGKPILLGPDDAKANLFPILNTNEADDEVEFNFCGPFRYPLAHLNVVDG